MAAGRKGGSVSFVYEVQRQGWRLECGDKAVLMYCGRKIDCILVDISISGVLVSCDDSEIELLNEGDDCGILLSRNSDECLHEIGCIVVRKDAGRVGLQFPGEV